MKKIAVIGLGYVGLPLAVEFGKHREVVGFDIDRSRIENLKLNRDVTKEISSDEMSAATQLTFSSDVEAIRNADIYIVTVPTPIDSAKRPDLSYLKSASATVGSLLIKGDIVIFESTVYPDATEEICVPILEGKSGLILNEGFFCGYSPERINPGDKVNTLTKIRKIISGSNDKTTDEIEVLYKSIINAGIWRASSIKVAEAAKVIENSQRDLNIAFINELAVILNRLDIDTTEVLEAAGSKWNFLPFRPGMVGGHCIGVDPYYLTHKAEEVGYNPQVILAGRRINDGMARYAAKSIIKKMVQNQCDLPNSRIGVLGLTFKENCPDIRNSKIVDLINELKSWGAKVSVVDPWADAKEVKAEYNISLVNMDNLIDLDALVVAVGHNEFRDMSIKGLKSLCRRKKVVFADLKAIYNKDLLISQGFEVFRL